MAEQQEKKRPQVRKVWVESGAVFLPDAGRLAGEAGKAELDAEGPAGIAHKLALSLTALGVVVRFVGARHAAGGRVVDVPHRVLIPWGVVRLVEVDEEWRP